MIRCNMCDTEYEDEFELELIETEEDIFDGCGECKTDEYLMDLE